MKTEPKYTTAARISKSLLRAGRFPAALPMLFLLFDGVANVMSLAPGLESTLRFGSLDGLAPAVWALEILYLVSSDLTGRMAAWCNRRVRFVRKF